MPPSAIWDLFCESFSFRSYLHEREARVQIIGKKMTSKINLILLERHALIDLSHENENESQQKWLGICMFLSEFGSNYLLSWWTVSVVKTRAMSAGWPILLPITGIVGIAGISHTTISSHFIRLQQAYENSKNKPKNEQRWNGYSLLLLIFFPNWHAIG